MRYFAIRDLALAHGSFAALRLAPLGASGTVPASIGTMKHLLALSSIVALLGLSAGCAHEDAARGNYHQAKAQRAAEQGDYHRAAKENAKASQDFQRADQDPLP